MSERITQLSIEANIKAIFSLAFVLKCKNCKNYDNTKRRICLTHRFCVLGNSFIRMKCRKLNTV